MSIETTLMTATSACKRLKTGQWRAAGFRSFRARPREGQSVVKVVIGMAEWLYRKDAIVLTEHRRNMNLILVIRQDQPFEGPRYVSPPAVFAA